ncbi:Chemotaxis protein methyltransferase Cher2 [Gammaproteobacteria bacterium]
MQQSVTEEEYRDFRSFLEDATGILLGDNKHYLVTSRLHRLLEEYALPNVGELMVRLRRERHGDLRNRVIEAMTTNETLWFRDIHPYEILKNLILPELARTGMRRAAIWSAACSTGQEPYSISMVVDDFVSTHPGALSGGASILATDISTRVLNEARRAVYDATSVARGLSEERRKRFMNPVTTKSGPAWEVRPEIRARVNFRELNLTQPLVGIGRFDVIFCRNVLIYFSSDLKRALIARLAGALNPRGWLILGASESIAGISDTFEMVRAERSVVYRSLVSQPSPPGLNQSTERTLMLIGPKGQY